jgi:predicted secreted protein
MNRRWLMVLATAAAFVLVPVAIAARPVAAVNQSAAELAQRVRASATVPWSGLVDTTGILQLPDNASFANLAQILGDRNRLRVWWRGADDWRVDRIRSTGERENEIRQLLLDLNAEGKTIFLSSRTSCAALAVPAKGSPVKAGASTSDSCWTPATS